MNEHKNGKLAPMPLEAGCVDNFSVDILMRQAQEMCWTATYGCMYSKGTDKGMHIVFGSIDQTQAISCQFTREHAKNEKTDGAASSQGEVELEKITKREMQGYL